MADIELSPSEVARRVGTTTRTVQRWIAAGILPARRVGSRWRVASVALDAFTTMPDPDPGTRGGHHPARSVAGQSPGAWTTVPIRHVFVANRGEIARRIGRTCERLSLRFTVPSTTGPNALDLLDIAGVVRAARLAGADAVHPGFGFLAENASFARAVIDSGLTWIGPPPSAIRAMGDKAAARRLARSLGIPVVPGYDDPNQYDSALRRAALQIGLPILVKPAAGGGGKGMRIVQEPEALVEAFASSRREARSAFGDDRLILEKLIEGPRHVEVQVLFDSHGSGVHLGERDCSLQRRHQKILEESPSPAVDEGLRTRLGNYALGLARAVLYVGAGTCEFLLTNGGEVHFLEMNTRLQVEHPVTELITGRDLVEDQIRIAAGQPLGVNQAEADAARSAGGHAVEVRLYAEDAEAGFLPATGRVERLRWPVGEGIRVDAGIDEGDEVTGRFDPMLAKIIARGANRTTALDRLGAALASTEVLGPITNLRFLRWAVDEPAIRDGQARIDTLDQIWPPEAWAAQHAVPDSAWLSAGRALSRAKGIDGSVAPSGWRLNAEPHLRLVADDGSTRDVQLNATETKGQVIAISVPTAGEGPGPGPVAHVDVDGRSVSFQLAPPPDVDRAARAAASHQAVGRMEVMAPMPGSVLRVHVAVGDAVTAGDPVVTLEAMKMEHVVVAPLDGTVTEMTVRPADQVSRGQSLAVVEP